jgi:putative RecB family exonuclease
MSSLRDQPHLSASAINTYIDCGLSYKFGKIDRLVPEFTPAAMVFGTVIHLVLESFYLMKKGDQTLTAKQVHELFENYWEYNAKDRDDIQYEQDKNYHSYLTMGRELLTVWHDKLPEDDFKVIATEVEFALDIPEVPVPVIGYMDLIEEDEAGTIIITDFKSTGRSYSHDEIDKNIQLLIYQMGAKANWYPDRLILLRLDCLIKTKVPKFEQHWSTRTEADERRVIRKIQSVWKGIESGVFLPNDTSWKCKGCAYKSACDQFMEGGEYLETEHQPAEGCQV